MLVELFNWSEQEFNSKLEGNPIRRIGYQSWLRNIAIAIGNSKSSIKDDEVISLLENKKAEVSDMVCEHIDWAITQLKKTTSPQGENEYKETNKKLLRTIKKIMPDFKK